MKPMILVALALMFGLVLGPISECAHARVVFNHDFEQVCRSSQGMRLVRDRSPRTNHIWIARNACEEGRVKFVPGRPGYGNALSINAPLYLDSSAGCINTRVAPGRCRVYAKLALRLCLTLTREVRLASCKVSARFG
jgi:hypothetical protein